MTPIFKVMCLAAALSIAPLLSGKAAYAGQNEGDGASRNAIPEVAGKLNTYAAVIGSDGTVIRAHTGTSVIVVSGFTGAYRVHFNKKISGCAFIGDLGTTGSVGVVSPGFLTVAGDALDADGVYVNTYNSAGASAVSSFHLFVTC